jgi:hypothetical protein
MGPDAILSPQSRFRDALSDLNHIFHFERGSIRERLTHQLSPPRQLSTSPNQRLA